MKQKSGTALSLTRMNLEQVFRLKHGAPEKAGWGPKSRFSFGYFTPDEIYESLVEQTVTKGCTWIDVGGGRDLFPQNRLLAEQLANRCGLLVAVDPSENVKENPFAHERVQAFIEDYRTERVFDVATLRMVAEHITAPDAAIVSLARLIKPGGKVIVYTVNRWSPTALLAWFLPFWLHHPLKNLFWGTQEQDTFPVAYKMNTHQCLAQLFLRGGFRECYFGYLDDCRTFHRFRVSHLAELSVWRVLKALGLRYPENCLLGVYERVGAPET